MTMKLDRRSFIKSAAATSAIAAAVSLFPGISFASWKKLEGATGIIVWQKYPAVSVGPVAACWLECQETGLLPLKVILIAV
ncbi:MAG: twin-arginine translocation signal domain-containing protein [Desulfobulbaceae bacterium]|nr:twin-arginine translocation signal domain-containing protein [Desulfobulbaceae bacterium]